MTINIESRVRQMVALWTRPNPDSLQRIIEICKEIADRTATGESVVVDQRLLRRAARLGVRAEQRCAECLALQVQTGNYSKQGEPELMSGMSTLGWEG
jgi:hypothetical protein